MKSTLFNDVVTKIHDPAHTIGKHVPPDFLRPIRLSPGCTRFNVGDIRDYVAKQTSISAKPKRAVRLKGGAK